MEFKPLPFRSGLGQYQNQAEELLAAHRSGDSDSKIRNAAPELADAQLTIARWYDFQSWPVLVEYVEAVTRDESPVFRFESAVEAVITGDLATLESLVRDNPELVRERSTRITHLDPPVHRATLLHYVAANGVEGYRQKTPKNAVAVAETLLEAGAEVDALADMYGERCTTMCLLVSSCHPARAGVQVALVETLLDFGAAIDGPGGAKWGSPVMTALAFGYLDAAEALVNRGAQVDNVAAAAGLGRVADSSRLLATADAESQHRALALAALHGHVDIVRLLLDAGENPDRYNPEGNHSHSTPLHQAVWAGHEGVVRLLVERGASLEIQDTIYRGTPLGWAVHGGKTEIENYLRAHGAAGAEDG